MRTVKGLTLLEMLVVLVLVSLLGTLLLQGVGFFAGAYDSVKRAHRDASLAALGQHWFASTVAAMMPHRIDERRFTGDASSFEGITLQPLAAQSGMPVKIRWAIRDDDQVRTVAYREENGLGWAVLASDDARLAFQYADSSHRWHDLWPAPDVEREWIPRMVRLVSATGETIWLARFQLSPEPVVNARDFS